MMQHQLTVQARYRSETLERILRVVRHRGFQVCVMNMETGNDNMNIELTVASLRPVELLFSQLARLADVIGIKTQQVTTQQIRAGAYRRKNVNQEV